MAFEELRTTLVMGIPLIRAGDKRTGIRDNHSAFRRAISSRISSGRSARSGSAESVPMKDNRLRGLGGIAWPALLDQTQHKCLRLRHLVLSELIDQVVEVFVLLVRFRGHGHECTTSLRITNGPSSINRTAVLR